MISLISLWNVSEIEGMQDKYHKRSENHFRILLSNTPKLQIFPEEEEKERDSIWREKPENRLWLAA